MAANPLCGTSDPMMLGRLIPRHAKIMGSLVPQRGFAAIPVASTKLLTNKNNTTTNAVQARSFQGIPQIEQMHFATTVYLTNWFFCGLWWRVYFEPDDIRQIQDDVIQLNAPAHLFDPWYAEDPEEEWDTDGS